jgi:hypothetical protein
MMTSAYDKFRRGERTALLPLMQAMRSGRLPTTEEFARLAIETGGKTEAVRAECLGYERALQSEGINPDSGRAAADDEWARFMASLKSFTFD